MGLNVDSNDGRKVRTAAEAGWHVSRYNVMARIPDSNKIAIYNTFTRTCAEYTSIELYIMDILDEIAEDHPLIPRLSRRGVIANYDEREAFELKRRLSCATAPGGEVAITICPTLACNFECPYCFATRGRGKMTDELQDDIVALAGRMLDAAHASKLTITWFGGEPPMATDVIESLSSRLIRVAEERGCEYVSWIFTNGYLLSEDVVDLLLRCRVTNVHIPLDGVGATNDATRRLVGGGPTYERIVDNLGLLKPPIWTLIRVNTHEGNVGEIDALRQAVLARSEEAGTLLGFYVAALVDVSPAEELDSPMAEYAFHGIEVALRPESRHVIVGKDHACVGQNMWMVAIDDKRLLYKCGGKLCGQPKYAYGTAHDWNPADPLATASNPDMLSKFLNTVMPSHDDKCYECVWLPQYGGGCPQLRLFGKPECPAYRSDPEAFVRAMLARIKRA
ncbi:MAG: radical SAM protein [Atopobiaceae bacterium]|nr:radical SAM protein [Atopobiaceae bacterium]